MNNWQNICVTLKFNCLNSRLWGVVNGKCDTYKERQMFLFVISPRHFKLQDRSFNAFLYASVEMPRLNIQMLFKKQTNKQTNNIWYLKTFFKPCNETRLQESCVKRIKTARCIYMLKKKQDNHILLIPHKMWSCVWNQ